MRLDQVPVFLLLLYLRESLQSAPQEFCQNESFKAKCAEGEVVVMKVAKYGRMRFSRCVTRDYGYVGQCEKVAIREADRECSGKQACEITVPNTPMDLLKPCPDDLKSFLQATYVCQKVYYPQNAFCQASVPLEVTGKSGYLSSWVTVEKKLGSTDCPWAINAKKGQRIRFTLTDFATVEPNQSEGGCHAYVTIREPDISRTDTICNTKEKERVVFETKKNRAEVRIRSGLKQNMDRQFLLKYEVFGCADPRAPLGGWMKRTSENKVEAGCTGEHSARWHMTCKNDEWVGKYGNCTTGAGGTIGAVTIGSGIFPVGKEISIVLIAGIALLIGIIILSVGLCILKWRRKQHYQEANAAAGRGRAEGGYYTDHGKVYDQGTYGKAMPMSSGESMYTSENEYAYISDMNLPPPPTSPGVRPSLDGQSYYSGGDTVFNAGTVFTGSGLHGGHSDVLAGQFHNVGEEPPKYFELESDMVMIRQAETIPTAAQQQHSMINNNRVNAAQNAPKLSKATGRTTSSGSSRNQPLHDFHYQPMERPRNDGSESNHKSV